VGSCGVELLRANLFEFESSHHRVEEDFEERQMISIGRLHDLDPLDSDLELLAFVLCFEDRQVCTLAQRVEAGAPVDVELELLLDLVSDAPEDILAKFLGVVWNFRVILYGVLVDALNSSLVEVDLEVVRVQRHLPACRLRVSGRSLRKESEGVGFHRKKV